MQGRWTYPFHYHRVWLSGEVRDCGDRWCDRSQL